MKKENDILKDCRELKEMPFAVPEGYFEAFKTEAKKPMVRKLTFMDRIAPYAAIAAMFIFLVTVGTLFLDSTTTEYEMTEEDYILFSDNMMNSLAYEMEYMSQAADTEISEDDIINYLIYTGVSAEHIELSK